MTTRPHTHRDRVAGTAQGFIARTATADGDAPPVTHTTPPATRRPTASTGPSAHRTPHSFTANSRTATLLVSAMVAVVLALAVLAIAVVLDGSPTRPWALAVTIGALVGFAALLTIPAAVASCHVEETSRRDCSEEIVVLGDGFWSIDEGTPQ